MLKTIWLSDPHFTADGDVLGHDPRQRLSAAVEHINAHHCDADFCVITGDMVNRGEARDYAAVGEMLEDLRIPVFPMTGNHDNRAAFRDHLPLPADCMADFIQYAVERDDAVALCLDTLDPGADGGVLCASRMSWLTEKLDQFADRPVIIFMHHPPRALGLPMQDQDMLRDGPAFLEAIKGRENILHLCIGHVHRPISGVMAGVPFSTMRSVLYQAPPPRPLWDWNSFRPAQEAPGLGVVIVDGWDVTIQFEQFCAFEVGVAE